MLKINGSGFLPSSVVVFNGKNHPATFINSSQLSIPLSEVDLGTVGDFSVTVSNGSVGAVGYLRVQGGLLQLSISGLPTEQSGSVSISSPGGFTGVVSSTRTIEVPPGTYLVAASGVGEGGVNYYADPASQSVTIADGSSGAVEVSYKIVTAKINEPLDPRMSFSLRQGVLADSPVPE